METLKCVSTNKDRWGEIIGTKNGCQDVVVLSQLGTCQFCRSRDQINQSVSRSRESSGPVAECRVGLAFSELCSNNQYFTIETKILSLPVVSFSIFSIFPLPTTICAD